MDEVQAVISESIAPVKKKPGRKPLPMGERKRRRQVYFAQYYQQKKEEIAERRRLQRLSDPTWKALQDERSRQYAQKKRAAKEVRSPHWKQEQGRSFTLKNGQVVQAFSLKVVSQRLGGKIVTWSMWRRIGKLPPSPLQTPRGEYYTMAMGEAILRVIQSLDVKAYDGRYCQGQRTIAAQHERFRQAVQAQWDSLFLIAKKD